MKKSWIIPLGLLLCTSCATMFSGTKSRITLTNDSVEVPVELTVDGKKQSDVYFPTQVKVKRGFKPSRITAQAPGYEDGHVSVRKKFNGKTLWNIILGGIPGFAVDAATGAITKPDSETYYVPMRRKEEPANYVELPVRTSEPEGRVSRDNPGETDLERTIVRWYFDSDPRGARIYWRVISSVPAEVKNTNENYLMTTPFEETRSFNILGLTYENSRNVQIEIKVSKRGYEDQIKRFNVRQALDQQEISGFFELVPKQY
ncbi:MAG: hypothetical protein HFJ82_03425 [Alistipes sp.]|jgi:hypothetical protein|uniref:hypothetical protein n=1 Tax=uncultured Alistipes sp. TaxID=538949 RepID=UPI002593D3BF|nr:hypothetical protein [uncultured Alistipes sp.]MCI9244541.1 hypothetical protein [Alistipes sp.]